MGPLGLPELLFLAVVAIGGFAIAIGLGKVLARILSEEQRKILGGIALLVGVIVVIFGIISINSAMSQVRLAVGRPDLGGFYAIPIGTLLAALGITLIVSRGSSGSRAECATTKKCQFCAETIRDEAKICRFCGRDQASSASNQM